VPELRGTAGATALAVRQQGGVLALLRENDASTSKAAA